MIKPRVKGVVDGGTTVPTVASAVERANRLGGGVTIALQRGRYDLTSPLSFDATGIRLKGAGSGATILNINDAGGMKGRDAITINSVLSCSVESLTITSSAPRTAGAMIKVLGKNHITATPAEQVFQYIIRDVNAEDQFNGLVVNDGPNSQGAWGGLTENVHWKRFSAGGTYFHIETPNGGQQTVANAQLWGSHSLLDADRALAAVRYRAGADLELINVTSVYHRYGLLIDPDAHLANVCIATGCDWDNNTRASISLTPSVGGQCLGTEINGGWGYTTLSGLGYPCIDINPGVGCNADNTRITGGTYWGNLIGCRIGGAVFCTTVEGVNFSACTTGILATGNATDFILSGNMIGKVTSSVPLVGIQVDAGCDHYVIKGNHLRYAATPIINTPGTAANQRIVVDNVTA